MALDDLTSQIELELAKRRSGKQVEQPWWVEPALTTMQQIPIQRQRVAIWQDRKLSDQSKSLTEFLEVIDNEEAMKLYDKELGEFTSDSTGYADHTIASEKLNILGNQKRMQLNNFSDGVQQFSDFIDSGEYLSKQSDFINLPSTVDAINAKRKASNKNPYEGTFGYLKSEKDRALGLMDKILPGMQFNKDGLIVGTNFKYNKANNNDRDVARKVMDYYNRIELATKTIEGDGIITPDEARAILTGDMGDYIKTRDTALTREKGLYINNKSLFARYSGYINTAEQKKLNNDDFGFMAQDPGFKQDSSEYQVFGQELGIALGEDATQDDWDKIIQTLVRERNSYKTLMNTANEKYKYWSGRYYEGAGGEVLDEWAITEAAKQYGVTPDKFREIQKDAGDRGMGIDEFIATEKEAFDKKLTATQEQEKFEEFRKTLPPLGAGRTVVGEGATAKRFPTEVIEPETTLERNNPGNLRFANQTDATGEDKGGYAVFDTAEEGWQALYNQINKDKTRDLTLEKFINKYAPPSENDTTAYLRNVQRELKVAPSTNINKLNTKELANAIAKQEGYAGDFPEKKKVKKVKGSVQLTEERKGKTVVNYDVADAGSFKQQQVNLQNVASNKFKSLSKDDKKKYGNARDFVKSKFEEWIKKTKKFVRVYNPGDFKYFIPTKVDQYNKVNPNPDMNLYNLYYPEAFSGVQTGKITRALIRPNMKGDNYLRFAKDFDAFRKYLQES